MKEALWLIAGLIVVYLYHVHVISLIIAFPLALWIGIKMAQSAKNKKDLKKDNNEHQ